MSLEVKLSSTIPDLGVVIATANPQDVEESHEVVVRHKAALAGIVTQQGLETLANIMPVVDNLGVTALNGIFDLDWYERLEDVLWQTDAEDLVMDSALPDDHPLSPLRDVFWDLSKIACRNTEFWERHSYLELVENDAVKVMHPDPEGGHTFLSNFNVEGSIGFVSEVNGVIDEIEVVRNQLIVLGGSANALPAVEGELPAYETVMHQALHKGWARRVRFNTYLAKHPKLPDDEVDNTRLELSSY